MYYMELIQKERRDISAKHCCMSAMESYIINAATQTLICVRTQVSNTYMHANAHIHTHMRIQAPKHIHTVTYTLTYILIH